MPSAMPAITAIAIAGGDPLEARHDVLVELREEPQVLELDENRRQARELDRVGVDGPELPRHEDRHRDRDLQADLQRPIGPRAHRPTPSRCDGCQRSARRSSAEKTMWMAIPRHPVAIASA